MYLQYIVFCGFISAMIGIYKKKLYHPLVLFNIFWSVIACAASLGLYGMKEADAQIYQFILIGMVSFSIGTFLPNKKYTVQYTYELNKKSLYFLLVLSFGVLLLIDLNSIKYLLAGYSLYDIRYSLQSKVLINKTLHRIYKFVVVPFGLTLMPIWVWEIIAQKSKNKKFIIAVLVYQVLCVLVEAAIHPIYNFLVVTIFFCIIFRENIHISKHTKRKMLIAIGSLFLGIILMKIFRKSKSSLFKHIYTYFTCGIPFFSVKYQRYDIFEIQTMGITSLQGLIRPLMGILEMFGLESKMFNEATNFIMSIQNEAVRLTPDKYFNFFITCFAYFYKDIGIKGIVIFSMLWGYFSKCLYRSLNANINIRSMSLYLLVIVTIFLSMMHVFSAESETVWAFIYLMIITKKRERYHEDLFCIISSNKKY